ncbi:MAG: hypothetical protein FWC93_05570 [Defluviitaleaceae bacterium]|nr:hypothetical protein [Defluviitaleaceae bacterium]
MSQYPNQPGGQQGKSLATASMVLGIVALVFLAFNAVIPFLEVIIGVAGIVTATSARKQGYKGGMAVAGLVCSIIAVALGGLYWLMCTMCGCGALCALPFLVL